MDLTGLNEGEFVRNQLEKFRAQGRSESCKQKSIEKTKKVPQSLRDRKWA